MKRQCCVPMPNKKVEQPSDKTELFVDAPPDGSEGSDSDSTDSEESVYSGLEEEEDTSNASEEESDNEEAAVEDSDEDSVPPAEEAKPTRQGKAKGGKSKVKKPSKQSQPSGSLENTAGDTHAASTSQSGADEYEYDSSDEEDIRNTVGNIPMEWYREFEHIGYDLLGKKIIKPEQGDELDEFVNRMDNPDYWRTVRDRLTNQKVVLSDKDVQLIQRFRRGKTVDPSTDPYAPWVDTFTSEVMIHPVTNRPEHKRSFIPSLWEKQEVGRIVHAMKMGWIKPKPPTEDEEDDEPKFYNLWENENESEINKRFNQHIPAPKMRLPGHAESYNPPPEYLFTEEEELAWKAKEPEERKINFIPKKFSSFRLITAYPRFCNERFERCLDLYLCPRQRKMRMNVDPEDLIPKLPKPKDLQPFPSTQALVYRGHAGMVRCISVSPDGQWLVSGSDDSTLKFWEVATARCLKTLHVGGVVKDIAWNPNVTLSLVAAIVDCDLLVLNAGLGDKLIVSNTDNILSSHTPTEENSDAGNKLPVHWHTADGKKWKEGHRVKVTHPKALSQVTWHGKGDYLAVVMPQADSMSVLIHQLSRQRTQNPFRKPKGLVQRVLFHPLRPFLFVATQRYVRVYNLLKQELVKKLQTNCKWVSSMAVHPGGDNVIIGSYDCRLGWFDLDLSTKPYQVLRHHKKAIRQVCYHKTYPLFASASDDGTVIVCHGRVYNDLLQNPLIVPVKVLRGHTMTSDLGVLDCKFHPTQPWVFSSGSDHTIRLFT
ncbi:hypothetical protein NP493_122g03038 [Ridgeia piscesae]|uniref:Ribosome biogenesis protein BOP1 homolog n=1 Tax=Ridgeia piscesae TaxID=27915 RepID=A0AAD9P634_RIDPI|nr:hypothetical protein NP493_122g03038 [Ridgeia piscesae]